MGEPLQLLVGTLIIWAPGLALVWAFAPGLDWAKFTFASVVVAVSVTTATVYLLSVFLGLPITPMNFVLVSLAWAFFGLAWAAGPRLEKAWG